MHRLPEVIAIGEALVDVAPVSGADQEYPGGSPANVAIALARLGRRTMLGTQIGSDARGRVLDTWLSNAGVRVSASSPATGRTSIARVEWDSERNANYTFDIAWDISAAVLDSLPAADAIHVGSIATVLAPGSDVVESFVAARATSALVTFDPNARPQVTPDRASATAQVERLIRLSDVVKVSDEDLAWYRPNEPAEEAARSLLGSATSKGPIVIAITRGRDGATILRGGDLIEVEAPGSQVVDTIAAGDAFTAGLIDALLNVGVSGSSARKRLLSLTLDELRHAARWAATAASITVSRPGADPPTRFDLNSAFNV